MVFLGGGGRWVAVKVIWMMSVKVSLSCIGQHAVMAKEMEMSVLVSLGCIGQHAVVAKEMEMSVLEVVFFGGTDLHVGRMEVLVTGFCQQEMALGCCIVGTSYLRCSVGPIQVRNLSDGVTQTELFLPLSMSR